MITIEEKNIEAAYKVADENGKKLLDALFGTKKPNLDDYTSIKTYEDACEALDETPIYSSHNAIRTIYEHINGHWDYLQDLPDHIIALLKLETISRALWGREFQPEPDDAEGSKNYWYPWFALWTKEEINERRDRFNGGLLSAYAGDGALVGFGCLGTYFRSSRTAAYIGFRLCQETDEKAKYFGQQFIELWADYLRFNFTTGGKYEN